MHRPLLAAALAAAFLLPRTGRAQACGVAPGPAPRLALVLSGGGAKGFAHIGVLRTLDSLGIRPDLVVGTSMGAVVGALYASGYSARTIDSLARALPIVDFFRSFEPRAPRALGPLQPLLVWEFGPHGLTLQSAAVREPEVAALLDAGLLRGNLIARGDFDRLPIPFRAVATDLGDRSAVVLRGGDLAQAVRASIAIPLVFAPERIHGRFLADGGLSANIPVAIARAAGAGRVIVSDVTEHHGDTLNLYSPFVLADRLLGFLFEQPADSLGPGDVYVRPDVAPFKSLDFGRASVRDLIRRGRRAADSVLRRPTCPAPPLAASPLPTRVGAVRAGQVPAADRSMLVHALGLQPGDSLDLRRLGRRLRALGRSERFAAAWLHPTGAGDSVAFNLAADPAPDRALALGAAYDNELGGRMWLGGVARRLFGAGLDASTVLSLGNFRKELAVALQGAEGPIVPEASLRLAAEPIRAFAPDGAELPELKTRELIGSAGIAAERVNGWEIRVGAEGRLWRNPDFTSRSAVGAALELSRPGRGVDRLFSLAASWTTVYRRVTVSGAMPFQVGALRILPRARLSWGDSLPVQLAFPLGGDDGFPGLHLGERRGDREAWGALQLGYPIAGPVLLSVEAAAGRSGAGGALLGSDNWLVGARAGLGADTPIGPVRAEYGIARGGRKAVFVRIGRWF